MRRILIAAFLACTACNPFDSLSTDEEIVVPDSEVAKIELLVPGRHLPRSARNVRMHLFHFQDTSLRIRFEAEAAEARAFAEQLLGTELSRTECVAMSGAEDWWISEAELPRAVCGRDTLVDGDGLPYVKVALIRSGSMATVWLHTFGP